VTTTTRDQPSGGLNLPDSCVIQFPQCSLPARGLFVGNLFVRAAFRGECAQDVHCESGEWISSNGMWIVEAPLTGYGICTTPVFRSALLIADEISRWHPEVHDAQCEADIRALFGGPIDRWVQHVQQCDMHGRDPLDYRRWRCREVDPLGRA
jgi:hypothetical protein